MLDQLGSGVMVLAVVALLFLVVAFLGHSVGSWNFEPREPTRRSLAANGVVFGVLGISWGYFAWSDLGEPSPDWFLVALYVFAAVGSLFTSASCFRAASRTPA